MFSSGHLLWIAISFVLIITGIVLCLCLNPPFEKVLRLCFVLGLVSELIKIFSVSNILPIVDPVISSSDIGPVISYVPAGQYSPYIENAHLPFELCSLQILFYVIVLKANDPIWKKRFTSLIFVTGIIGGVLGITMAYIVSDYSTVYDYFISARVWQYFLYHSMVVTVGIYAGFGKESSVTFSDLKSTVYAILSLDFISFYLNSIFSEPVYTDTKPVGLLYRSNFFSSYVNPLGIILTQKWQWIVYLIIRMITAIVMITLLFLIQKIIRSRRDKYS